MPFHMFNRRFTLLTLCGLSLVACANPATPPAVTLSTQTPLTVAFDIPTATTLPTATALPTATTVPTTTSTPVPTATPFGASSAVTGENSFARGAITARPWMVMIDNHPDAYPQSGMDRASMVFEGLAEYGLTRFIALYQDDGTGEIGEIGPVRSTRLYFAQWAMGFHPIYAHAGGSPDGVQLVESTDQLINFEALRQPRYTWRDATRIAPHNLYTNATMLRSFARDKAVPAYDESDIGYLFDNILAASPVETSQLDYFFLDTGSRAGFRYDAVTNGYYRVMRGRPHVDRITGQQLWTRNVVVMQVNEATRPGDDKQRIDQEVIGSGPARVFLAGRSLDVTWRKERADMPLRFYDANDVEVVFNAGPIWIAAIPTMDRLTTQ